MTASQWADRADVDPTTLFARQPLPGVKVSETPPAPPAPPTPPAPAPPAAQPPAAAVSYQGQPPWVTAELPPQYGELANKIAAIQAEARKYEDIAGVVWQSDRPLIAAVRNLFAAMQFETEVREGASYDVSVQVESGRRLLIVVVASKEGIPRKSPQIGQLVRTLQEDAGPQDRVVLAANAFCETPVSSRQDAVAPTRSASFKDWARTSSPRRRCSDSGSTRSRIWRARRRASFGCTRRTAASSDKF